MTLKKSPNATDLMHDQKKHSLNSISIQNGRLLFSQGRIYTVQP